MRRGSRSTGGERRGEWRRGDEFNCAAPVCYEKAKNACETSFFVIVKIFFPRACHSLERHEISSYNLVQSKVLGIAKFS